MRWYVKLLKEDEKNVYIGYSYEKNNSCDGVLQYNKGTENIDIEKLSDGADEFSTRWLFGNLYNLIRKKAITGTPRVVAIG